MSKAQCPKCGAGRAALELVKEPTILGFERFIKCCQCGNRIYEPSKTVITRTFKARRTPSASCKVEGCTGTIHPTLNKTGFCSRCLHRQNQAKIQGNMPFYVEVAGKWIANPERISA